MVKPRLIILIRHAQSEGNKNRDIHQTIPDHRVKLTQDGWQQAYEAGRNLRKLLRADDTLHFFTSPYRRTRETTEGILSTLTSDEEDPSPFKRSNIKVYEEPRLREQDFGNFQPCSAEMERMWQERADYGHFFYRIPNGESAADAYDRVSGFNESLWRQFGENDFASVCVLVTHGLMSRVFLMKWYHFTVEYFEDLRNVNHCEFLIMRKQEESGKYILENKLRTWSELRKERAELKEKEEKERSEVEGNQERSTKDAKNGTLLERSKTFIVTRRWGGCPNGCNHKSHYQRRDDLEALRRTDEVTSNGTVGLSRRQSPAPGRRPIKRCEQGYTSDEGTDSDGRPPQIDVTRARHEVVSSPDGTPSFISAEDRLRSMISPHLNVGRDFGGTFSGQTSIAGSDTDSSEEDGHRPEITAVTKIKVGIVSNGDNNGANGSINSIVGGQTKGNMTPNTEDEQSDEKSRRRRANRLGDTNSSHRGSEADEDDIDAAEKRDRSILGSVY
ncbi:hypothetical protein COL5a_009675 [Colletotrichum fioriniae]|uniref:uncharacterized protein n=1 Tax=Colletotrichum fioriniae TaxID=710243 RepID=UPI002301F0B6|nr:uncharacterized protein COL516b_009515 [Colletotrichum fioriniae]KAJ0298960.1 hypothetical protein COL516b_009515 [Colletotrichum fioriniae]KAJ0320558.1 hypothetical protein COL5a_009675 [Colletotrichum fioriniae]KAJ3943860.1 hypothetical protein N0V96_006793 [Colletotrichum fioriniae]